MTPETLWSGDNYGTTDSAKKHLLSLFPEMENVFDTPKPEELIKQIIEIASNEGEYVLDCYIGSGTTMATAHKLNRNYIGIEIGDQMVDLVVRRMKLVINGEGGGVSSAINWNGGGQFALYNFDKTKVEERKLEVKQIVSKQQIMYHQLDLFNLFEQYGEESIIENSMVCEDVEVEHDTKSIYRNLPVDLSKNLLICNVKRDNWEQYLDGSAKIYYTGKKFPSTVALNKLYYFMPYLSGKGIRDLYYIKIARLGYRKEGQTNEDKNDLRLVFEIERVGQLLEGYRKIRLEIWRTFTDTTMKNILGLNDET